MNKNLIALALIATLAGCNSEQSNSVETETNVAVAETGSVMTLDKFFTDNGEVVTKASFPTAETSHQMLKNQDLAGINTFLHKRYLAPTDNQPVVRMNRDTYYSFAVVDVSKGATITLPELPEGKFISVQPVTEDHRIQEMQYGAGTYELSTHNGSHLYLVVRLDSSFSTEEATKYQDQITLTANSSNKFTAKPVNKASFVEVENTLKAQLPVLAKRDGADMGKGMFTDSRDGSNELFTQEKYEIGAAAGWGGAQLKDVIYESSPNFPNDACYQATFEDPKNNAFWSFTVYNKAGFMFNDVANINSDTAQVNKDGTYTVSFGCGSDAPNNVETANDTGVFNLAVRHYQPSDRVSKEGYRLLPQLKAVQK